MPKNNRMKKKEIISFVMLVMSFVGYRNRIQS
jgi:hypothetical protein